MFNLLIFLYFMYFMSCLIFTFLYHHILMILMSLEIMMITLMMYMYMFMLIFNFEYFLMFYLLISVCEGVLGLTLLILFIRFNGSDKTNLMHLNMW